VLCLVATQRPPAVVELVSSLRAALAKEGFTPEAREYRPHVTLARKVRQARKVAVTPVITWPADRFALVRSVVGPSGSRYEPLGWWNAARRKQP
jgi:2'-5' RNA ligase